MLGLSDMDGALDPIHAAGYLGALGSLVFGVNQLRILWRRHEAKDISVFDYGVRVAYSVLLGIYSVGIQNVLFVIVNVGAALLSLAVAASAMRMKRERHGGRRRRAA